jgi:hypothetical protein
MKEWCLEHPYLTTLIVLFLTTSFTSVVNQLLEVFKKPTPVTYNIDVNQPPPDEVTPPPESLN